MSFPFNVRVYGVLNHGGRILVVEEYHAGKKLVKFPGGGLEFGEGPAEGVVREFLEETELIVRVVDHLYTTHFFQVSAFDPRDQIISIYYRVEVVGELPAFAVGNSFVLGEQLFFWKDASSLRAEDFTLPIDRYVVEKVRL